MPLRKNLALSLLMIAVCTGQLAGQDKLTFDRYHSPEEVGALLRTLADRYPQLAKLQEVGKSAGGTALHVVQLAAAAPEGPEPGSRPAVLICANLEGNHLIGTEAALLILDRLLSGYEADQGLRELLGRKTIYIAPLLNPDAAHGYFTTPRWERTFNSNPADEDLDLLTDEDGPDDLNQDGLITMMRVKDPEGDQIADPAEPRLMRKADPQKGESGMYKIYVEGLDNDGDGNYNEDPVGGAELNRNFPHDFENNSVPAGRWPVSQKETIALASFLLSHPNIALMLNFSTENTILNLEQTGRARAAGEKVKVPPQFAGFLGLDPEQEYDLKELVELIKGAGMFGGMEITEERVAQFLGLGPAVTLDRQDQQMFEAVQKEFKDALKAAKLEYPEKRARAVGRGSLVAYCYYQYGVPVFSNDIWAVPETKKQGGEDELTFEKIKTMTKEQFLALEENRLDDMLKKRGAPPRFGGKELKKMVESGQMTPARIGEMAERMMSRALGAAAGGEHPDSDFLKWSDSSLQGKGFVPWSSHRHPTLGDVEIGGFAPFAKTLPPPDQIEKSIQFAADFYLRLMSRVASLVIRETKVEAVEGSLYNLACYLTNPGWLPTSTAQGRRAATAWPITVRIKTSADQSLFSGRPIESIPFLGGSGDTRKVEWTVRGKRGSTVEITAESPRLGKVSTRVTLQ